ncbi:MAG: hypothetical protein AB8F74_02965 [Saprospiraceae bacterium]
MQRIIIKTIVVFLISQSSLFAQEETPLLLIDQFFKTYVEQGITPALESLYATNKWVGRNSDMVIQLKNKMETELGDKDFVGEMHGYEPITLKKLGDSYMLYSYLVKYDRQPIRFTFQFYKPNDKWMLYAFKYDGGIPEEIEESAKMYYDMNRL